MSSKVVDELTGLIRKLEGHQNILVDGLEKLLKEPSIPRTVVPETRVMAEKREEAHLAVTRATDAITAYRRAVERQRDLFENGG